VLWEGYQEGKLCRHCSHAHWILETSQSSQIECVCFILLRPCVQKEHTSVCRIAGLSYNSCLTVI
jgi:hypothetical protein